MIDFKKLILSLILMGLLSVTPAIAMENEVENKTTHVPFQKNYQELKAVGERYVTFLQKIAETPVTEKDVSPLFAPHCKKVVNGKVLCTLSSELTDQLNTARANAGKWAILETLFVIPAVEDGACSLQIRWKAEKMEQEHTTLKVLFIDNIGKIYQIDEVYSECLRNTLGS